MGGYPGVGLEDGEVLLGAPVSGGVGVFMGRGRWVGEHRLDENHLGGRDHRQDPLHRRPEAPGLQRLWGVARLQGPEKHKDY